MASIGSAVLRVPCPVDGCGAMIPMRATTETLTDGHLVLEFSSTAVRAHCLLTHGYDPRDSEASQ